MKKCIFLLLLISLMITHEAMAQRPNNRNQKQTRQTETTKPGATPANAATTVDIPEFSDFHTFSESEMDAMWQQFSADKGFANLLAEVEKKGFKPINISEAKWGFKTKILDDKGKSVDGVFCAFDFYNPNSKAGQGCSMIWQKVGDEFYKAYMIFPEGVEDPQKAFENATEWFVDNQANVQKANSFHNRFMRCVSSGNTRVTLNGPFGFKSTVRTNCLNSCLGAVAICGGTTAILSVASGGFAVPVTAAIFFGCAGVACGTCMAVCALASR